MLKLEDEYRDKEEKLLGEKRKQLNRKKEDCLRSCNMRLEKLKESLVQEELEAERKYLKFEENLRDK